MVSQIVRHSSLLPTTLVALAIAWNCEPAQCQSVNAEAQRAKLLVRTLGSDGAPQAGVHVLVSIWSDDPFRPQRDHITGDEGQIEVELPGELEILRVWARNDGHAGDQ